MYENPDSLQVATRGSAGGVSLEHRTSSCLRKCCPWLDLYLPATACLGKERCIFCVNKPVVHKLCLRENVGVSVYRDVFKPSIHGLDQVITLVK